MSKYSEALEIQKKLDKTTSVVGDLVKSLDKLGYQYSKNIKTKISSIKKRSMYE